MAKIVAVRFRGKLFYCDANDIPLQVKDFVVLKASHGSDLAEVISLEPPPSLQAEDEAMGAPLMTIVRRAGEEDMEAMRRNREKEDRALVECKQVATELELRMKPLSAHYNLEGSHVAIFFSAQQRVDFRELVRKLSRGLKTHVELRQIGPRDEARTLSGLGKCGYPLCCQSFLTNFAPVSIRMAKEQDLTLSPMRISGICGRLLCCLSYESKQYASVREEMPQVGQEVSTPFGKATVVSTNPLKEVAMVRFDDQTTKELPRSQLVWDWRHNS